MEKLLGKVHSEWEKEVLYPFIDSKQDTRYSLPYYIGLSKHHDSNLKTIMIVGQEARNYGQYDSLFHEWSREKLSEWNTSYLDRQLFNDKDGTKYNRSSFWTLARKLNGGIFNILWNNLDKLHKYSADDKTKSLSELEELPLHQAFNKSDKSLLLQEIEILKPDLIILTTGPNYIGSMAAGLRVTKDVLKPFRPTVNSPFSDISEITGLKIPVYWSYHPSYLNRIDKIDELVKKAHEVLK